MSFWQPQLLLVMRQPFDFGVQAFASEAVSACNFLGQPISIHVPNFLYIRTSQ